MYHVYERTVQYSQLVANADLRKNNYFRVIVYFILAVVNRNSKHLDFYNILSGVSTATLLTINGHISHF